jgi:prepilin-type N-terminal cleavage/methylation domain-containing protein
MAAARMTKNKHNRGFSLVELLLATFIFTMIAGIIFSLLSATQLRYQSESNVMSSFQQANIAMDQIARDVHSAGYPAANSFNTGVAAANPHWVALPFAWAAGAGYPTAPCTVKGSCGAVPGDFDLIFEADFGKGVVQWVRYSLSGTTLMRGVADKVAWADPVAATDPPALVPYLENVMNNATPAQMAQIRASYPAMFPGDLPVPIFTFTYDSGALQIPGNIRQVNVCLIVQSSRPDSQTGRLRVVTLTGQAARFNPNQ